MISTPIDILGPDQIAVPAPTDPRFQHLAWPKIQRLRSGRLLAACSAGRCHAGDGQATIGLAHSDDDGDSWSPLRLMDIPGAGPAADHVGNIAIGQAADGAVVLLAMSYRGAERAQVHAWRSPDDGLSWQAAQAPPGTASVYGCVSRLPDDRLVVFGHYRANEQGLPTSGVWYSQSGDHGRSWGAPVLVSPDPLFEPAIIWTPGGYLGLVRAAPGHATVYHQFQCPSPDPKAEDWSRQVVDLRSCEHPTGLPCPALFLDPDDPARLVAPITERALDGNLPGRVTLWTARLPEVQWTAVAPLTDYRDEPGERAGASDFGYPWLAPLGSGRWLMIHYHGDFHGAADLLATRFQL